MLDRSPRGPEDTRGRDSPRSYLILKARLAGRVLTGLTGLTYLATGMRVSLLIRGYRDCWKVLILTWNPEYFRMIFSVSESVRKEFIRRRGTSVLYLTTQSHDVT